MYASASTRRIANQWRSKSSSSGSSLQASLRQYQSDQDHAKKRQDDEFTRRRMARNRKVTLNTKDPCYRVAVCLLLPTFICIVVGAVMTLCSHSRPIGVGTHFWESPRRSMYRWVGPVVLFSGSITMFFNYLMYKRAQVGPGSIRDQWERKKESQGGSILPRLWNRRPRKAVVSVGVNGPEILCQEGLLEDETAESVELQDLAHGQDNMTFKHSPMYKRKPVNVFLPSNWTTHKRAPLLSRIPFSRRQEIDIESDATDQGVDWRWSGIRPQSIKKDPNKVWRDRQRRDFLLNSLSEEPIRRRPDIVEPRPAFPTPDPATFKRVVLGRSPPDQENEWARFKVSRDSLLLGGRDRDLGASSPLEKHHSNSRLSPEIILQKARGKHGSTASFVSSQGSEARDRTPSPGSHSSHMPCSPTHLALPVLGSFPSKTGPCETIRRATAADIYQGQDLGLHSVSWRRASEPFAVITRNAGTQTPRRGRILRSRGKLKTCMDEAVQCNSPISDTSSAGGAESASLDSTQETVPLVCITPTEKADSFRRSDSNSEIVSSENENTRPYKVGSVPLIPTRLYDESRILDRIHSSSQINPVEHVIKQRSQSVDKYGTTTQSIGRSSSPKLMTQSSINLTVAKSNPAGRNQNINSKLAPIPKFTSSKQRVIPLKLPLGSHDPVPCILISSEDIDYPQYRLLHGSVQGENLGSPGLAANPSSTHCYQLVHMPGPPQAGPPQAGPPQARPPQAGPPQARPISSASSPSSNQLVSPLQSPHSSCGSVFGNTPEEILVSPAFDPTKSHSQIANTFKKIVPQITPSSTASEIHSSSKSIFSNPSNSRVNLECHTKPGSNGNPVHVEQPQRSSPVTSASTLSAQSSRTWNSKTANPLTESRYGMEHDAMESPLIVLEDKRHLRYSPKRPPLTRSSDLPSARSASILLESIDKVCRGAEFYAHQKPMHPPLKKPSGYSSDV